MTPPEDPQGRRTLPAVSWREVMRSPICLPCWLVLLLVLLPSLVGLVRFLT